MKLSQASRSFDFSFDCQGFHISAGAPVEERHELFGIWSLLTKQQ